MTEKIVTLVDKLPPGRVIHPFGDGIGFVALMEWQPRTDFTAWEMVLDVARESMQSHGRATAHTDRALMARMLKDRHGTPLRSVTATLRVKAPRFILRQLTRHQVGHEANGSDVADKDWPAGGWGTGTTNVPVGGAFVEVSGRYVDFKDAEHYIPADIPSDMRDRVKEHLADGVGIYLDLRNPANGRKVRKEVARSILSESVYGIYTTTMNLEAFLYLFNQRRPGSGAQWEATQVVLSMWELMAQWVCGDILALWADEESLPRRYVLPINAG